MIYDICIYQSLDTYYVYYVSYVLSEWKEM